MSSDSDCNYSIRHHTHKRKKIIKSDTESSNESIVLQKNSQRKRKIYRIISEEESSSDESDIPNPVNRRRNPYRVISEDESSNYDISSSEESTHSESLQINSSTSSEWQSDWNSSSELSDDNYNKAETKELDKPGPSLPASINNNSDSDEQSEKCPICLLPFKKQEVGTPSSCEHSFCLECLMEWSKNINTCPVDRQPFTLIHVKNHIKGKIKRQIPVNVVPRVEYQDDLTFCEICSESNREDRMLLCDYCDRGYHMECLTPPLTEVPIEEWYCPDCRSYERRVVTQYISGGVGSRRSAGNRILQFGTSIFSMYPYVIRSTLNRNRARARSNIPVQSVDPNLPSTSSGPDGNGENSRSRSLEPSSEGNTSSNTRSKRKTKRQSKTKATKKKKKKLTKKSSERCPDSVLREVRIRELNDNGEEEETVAYVKVVSSTSRRKCKKRTKKTRKRRKRGARGKASLLTRIRSVKSRLASVIGLDKPTVPTVRRNTSVFERQALRNSRYNAGIPQVSIFGDELGLDYSPSGSTTEDEDTIGNGPMINIRQRRSVIPSIRRRAVLKAIANPIEETEPVTDLLSSIMSNQELWHSSEKKNVIVRTDGTLVVVSNPDKENKHSINNNESPKKEKEKKCEKEAILKEADTPLDLSNVNPNDITQAPMYNNPCGGGGGSGSGSNRGNFRSGYSRDNGRQCGQNYGGGRDSLPPSGGRHSYGSGTGGGGPRDNFGNRDFGRPPFFNPNFEHCGGPPMFGTHGPPPPFRNRNPQHFRNERPRFPPPHVERPFNYPDGSGFEPRLPVFHMDRFPRPRPPLIPPHPGPPAALTNAPNSVNPPIHVHNNLPPPNMSEDMTQNYQPSVAEQNDHIATDPIIPMDPILPIDPIIPMDPIATEPVTGRQDNEDIYCDLDSSTKPDCDMQRKDHSSSMILLPPPEPPSGLLNFDENSKSDKDNESEHELVIDDSHKEETSRDLPSGDKYDPFAADSDSNDEVATASQKKITVEQAEVSQNSVDSCDIPMPNSSPVLSPSYPLSLSMAGTTTNRNLPQETLRLTAYEDDDDDNDSQSDCPNFSIYSSQTMDVARHTEQELSQQLGPLQPPPLPPSMPDDDDIIVGDVQACDMPDATPEPADPYLEALQKERKILSKIPPKKISHDSQRGKITFKIGNKLKLNNRFSGLDDQKKVTISPFEQQERDNDKNVDSSKPATESPVIEPSTLNQSKMESVKEDEKNASTESPVSSVKDKESPEVASRRESKDDSESSDEEATKTDKKLEDVDVSPNKKEAEDKEAILQTIMTDVADKDLTAESVVLSPVFPLSPKQSDNIESTNVECDSENGDAANKIVSSRSSCELQSVTNAHDDSHERDWSSDEYERLGNESAEKTDRGDKASSDNEDRNSPDQRNEKTSSNVSVADDEVEQFLLEKDKVDQQPSVSATCGDYNWESDGAYTPCKDELPLKNVRQADRRPASYEIGLEPITPTKDRTNDDLDDCRTPLGYAGLGTEAISETDETINFDEESTAQFSSRKKKETEDGEIVDSRNANSKEKSKEENDGKKKKKKDKKEKSKESTEKNKENISSDNLVSWKKLTKNMKERQYREKDKRKSKSKEKEKEKDKDKDKDKDKSSKKKVKEMSKKKEKRKDLPRYNVRKLVAEKPRPTKDEFGRDIVSRTMSRSRSLNKAPSGSRDRRSRSFSKGRSRSRSRLRMSWSRESRSYRSVSRRRSSSRARHKSSRKGSSHRGSLSRRHSISRKRSRSPSRKRRSLSPRRRSRRSLSRTRDKRKDKSKKYTSRSRSRKSKRSRSKSPKSSKSREKKHKRKARSRSRSKDRSVSVDRDRNRNWDQINEKSVEREQQFTREREEQERSWSAWTPSWSRSETPPHIQQEQLASRNWSPPPVLDSVSPKNLTVILTNKEAIKKKKKERRKESRKSKDTEKRRKSKRNRTPPPSKEVFASGDNILVSVCFNKDNETTNPTSVTELPTIPLMPPIKRRQRDSDQKDASPAKRAKKEKLKDKRSKSPKVKKDKKKKSKAAEIAATKKPVAVIDLDQSPFREQTPSPRDIIVLSDDDDKQVQETLAASPEPCPPSSQASPPREQFVSQGPKTPPEPAQIKFSINKQPSNLRPSLINPLMEEEEEEEEEEDEEEEEEEEEMMDEQAEEELEMRAQEELELRLKIGPNTPPEPPPPTSPDAYDPFDPTKSRSPTPDASQEVTSSDERDRTQRSSSPRKHDITTDEPLLPLDEPSNQQQDQPSVQEKPAEKPKIISMVTIKRPSPQRDVTTSPTPENQTDVPQSYSSPPQQNPPSIQSAAPFTTVNPVLATVAAAVQRSFNSNTPNTTQKTVLQSNRISPSNQMKPRTNDRPQLPNVFANSAKSSTVARSSKPTQTKNSSIGQNGSDTVIEATNDNVVDMSSPYSPGSTLSDGLFDPPSPTNFNSSPVVNAPASAAAKTTTPKMNKSAEKKDAFDALFSGIVQPINKPVTKNRNKKIPKEKTKKPLNSKVGVRMDENQLQILDDLPSSAVEMQVKDKFLKKLNRQERVVEEVKLVLKPHYTKKHVTKEEYKDIMRKAVPKICHNKTGEINPKKIALLIEAYVRKCRNNKKKTTATATSKKITKPLWS